MPAVDVSQPCPFPFESEVVFVCVDVESYERNHNQITEVGVATLDTRDIASVPPGENGIDWVPKIRTRHFRIKEHKHLVNGEFVPGAAHRFDFGESEIVRLAEARPLLQSALSQRLALAASSCLAMTPRRTLPI